MYRVLISDPLPGEARQILEATGEIEVIEQSQDLEKILPSVQGWIVRSGTQVTPELLECAGELRCICRAGAGVDNIDLEAATRHGVVVMNTPGSNSRAAAELTVGLMMSVARHIPFAHVQMAQGNWNRKEYVGTEVEKKTVGIVGMGKVGQHVARMARGLGMSVIAVDPFLSPEAATDLGAQLLPFEEMVGQADYITLHTPLTDATRGLLNADSFAKCRPGVRIINCSRGGVVDEAALVEAIEKGQVGAAALDVYAEEPPGPDSPLLNHPRIVTTPHLGASTREAQEQVATASGEQIKAFLCDGTVQHAVNTASLAGADRAKYEPLAQLARQLGWLQAQVLEGPPQSITVEMEEQDNVEVLQRLVTDHALAGFLQASADRPVNAVNARVLARERGLEVNFKGRTRPTDWIRWLGLEVAGPEGTRRVAGAVVGRNSLRLVRLDDFALDSALEGPLMLTMSLDRPGMIGNLGGLFGDLGINIANLYLGRDQVGGTALSIFQLDEIPSTEIQDKIRSHEGVTWCRAVQPLA